MHNQGGTDVTLEPFEQHFAKLQKAYVNASPARRAETAIQRMGRPEAPANMLILAVSATEALARALVLENLLVKSRVDAKNGKRKEPLTKDQLHKKIERENANELLTRIAGWSHVKPEEAFGPKTWPTFLWAVKYRNLLIHEATFLNEGHADALIHATTEIFLFLKDTYAGGWGESTHRMKKLP
jgi:hypothetical protein